MRFGLGDSTLTCATWVRGSGLDWCDVGCFARIGLLVFLFQEKKAERFQQFFQSGSRWLFAWRFCMHQ